MKMNVKKIVVTSWLLLCIFGISIPSYAAKKKDNNKMESPDSQNSTSIDLNACSYIPITLDGKPIITPFASIGQHTINAKSTMLYYNSNGTEWAIVSGTKVTIKANFDKSISWSLSYSKDGSIKSIGSGTSASINKTFTAPSDGYYTIRITNNSSSSVSVNSGSITY